MGYPRLVLEERLNGMEINLVGVIHSRDFFHKHENFFRNKINGSQAIFLEDGPREFTHEFDRKIAKLAQENNKPIYIIEPSKMAYLILEFAQIGTASFLGTSYLRINKNMSRRDFVKKGGATLFGAYLLFGAVPFKGFIQDFAGDESVKIDDAVTYGTIGDYRNLVAAENLDRISKKRHLEGQIPYFIGYGHVKGISAYLQNPNLRKKRFIYFPQDLISDTSVRKFEFQDNCWKLTERI